MDNPDPGKMYLSTRDFVAFIKANHLSAFTRSRFQKDRMLGVAPQPAARFGNRDLWTEDQAPPYVARLLNSPPRPKQTGPRIEPAVA